MMAESPQLVVDASVAVAELLRSQDEPYTDIARQVFTHFHEGRIRLIAPEHIRIEVGHALWRAVRRRRNFRAAGSECAGPVLCLGIGDCSPYWVLLGGWQLAQRYACSFYDAGYLALAVMTDCQFLHADGKLRNNLQGRFLHELWIEAYPY